MARLVLHIGMNRTGSSAIQTALRSLHQGGCIYPELGEAPYKPHHEDGLDQVLTESRFRREALTEDKDESSLADHILRRRRLAREGKEKIIQAARDAGDGMVILSGEGAHRYLSVSDLRLLKALTDEFFNHVFVIGYLRPPAELISSTFHNSVVGHKLARFEQTYIPYSEIKKFDDVFGRNAVHLFKYDRREFPNGDVVQHFCEMTGLPILAGADLNTTSSRASLAAIYRLNKLAEGKHRYAGTHKMLVKQIRRAFPHREWPRFRLSPELLAPLIEKHSEDLRWIEERLGRPLTSTETGKVKHDVKNEADLLRLEPKAAKCLRAITVKLPEEAKQLLEDAINKF